MDWKPFEKETTEDLIHYIKWRDDPEYTETSEAAFCAFTFRFSADLIKKCEVICRKWNNGSIEPARMEYEVQGEYLPISRNHYDPVDLATRTFKKFWETHLYDHSKRRSARTWDQGVKLYLYTIASNELANMYREVTNPNPWTGNEAIIHDFPEILGDFTTESKKELKARVEIIDRALSRLGPKHKIIYLTYKTHSKEGKYLPAHLLEQMREELNLAQNTIRFYKMEAIKTVNNSLKWEKKNI